MTSTRIASLAFVLALATAGCPVTDTPGDDAAGADASPSTDTFPSPEDVTSSDAFRAADVGTDAFLCPDLDGDGAADSSCGGADCDDSDPTLVSFDPGSCSTPTTVRRCSDGVLTLVECGGDTPYCDARVAACVADACGDGVLHTNESCELPDRYCPMCHARCSGATRACDDDGVCRPYDDGIGGEIDGCGAPQPDGAANGTPCSGSDECFSGYCDRFQGRCTSIEPAMCRAAGSWWAQDVYYFPTPARFPNVCVYSCLHQDECRGDSTCVVGITAVSPFLLVTSCHPQAERGVIRFGDECMTGSQCDTGVCVAGRCSRVCRDDADCAVSLPTCTALDQSDVYITATPRPDGWPTPWPLVCTR